MSTHFCYQSLEKLTCLLVGRPSLVEQGGKGLQLSLQSGMELLILKASLLQVLRQLIDQALKLPELIPPPKADPLFEIPGYQILQGLLYPVKGAGNTVGGEYRLDPYQDGNDQDPGPDPLVELKDLVGHPGLLLEARSSRKLLLDGIENQESQDQRINHQEEDHGKGISQLVGRLYKESPAAEKKGSHGALLTPHPSPLPPQAGEDREGGRSCRTCITLTYIVVEWWTARQMVAFYPES